MTITIYKKRYAANKYTLSAKGLEDEREAVIAALVAASDLVVSFNQSVFVQSLRERGFSEERIRAIASSVSIDDDTYSADDWPRY